MDVKANSLYQEMQAMIAQTRLDVNPQPQVELNTSKSDFSQLLSNAIEKVNDMQEKDRKKKHRRAKWENWKKT